MRFVSFHRARPGMDMTPMIDVTLQLIIFFMFTQQFVVESRLDLRLPQQSGEPALPEEGLIVVDVDASGSLFISTRAIDLAEFAQVIQRAIAQAGEASRVRVLVRADESAPARAVNQVASTMAGLGVRQWKLATRGN